jgi:hypothetical protein
MKEEGHLSNSESQRRLRQREKDKKRQAETDLKEVMSTAQGRRFVWRLIRQSGTFDVSFTGNNTTFFNEGRRSVGVELMTEAQSVAAADYVHMLTETLRASEEDALLKKSAEGLPETD